MPRSKPGVPSLLRELNDAAALNLIIEQGAVTRADLAKHSGLSRVTSSQALQRLEARGLISVHEQRAGAKGPAADVYALTPGLGLALGLAVHSTGVRAEVCTLAGEVLAAGEAEIAEDIVSACLDLALRVLRDAGSEAGPVLAATVATPGVVDPRSGDLTFSYDFAGATDLRERMEAGLEAPVALGNDVHLAALAERLAGAAVGEQDFVLLWIGRGLGMAGVIDGQVRSGSSGAAGEIGYLPVPGVALPTRVDNVDKGSFQRLVGAEAIELLAEAHGVRLDDRASIAGSEAFVEELAHRISLGVASIGTILDPALFVLTGETAMQIGDVLAPAVARSTTRIAPIRPRVEISHLGLEGPLRGARVHAVEAARKLLLERARGTEITAS